MAHQPQYSLQELSSIQAPTLIMAGDHDVVARSTPTNLRVQSPGAEARIVVNGTHNVAFEKPGAVNKLILDSWTQLRISDSIR